MNRRSGEGSGLKNRESTGSEEHARKVSAMFGRIAGWYDFLNHFLSLGQDYRWRRHMIRMLNPVEDACVLDVAAGTMDVSREILRKAERSFVTALDFSLPMLQKGRHKVEKTGRAAAVAADGRFLPLRDNSLHGATIAFGIRNILPREAAYKEILRVLKPGGRFVVLEFGTGKRRIWGGAYNLYLGRILPGIGKMFSGDGEAYGYLARTIREFPDERQLAEEMQKAGFVNVEYKAMSAGIVFLHKGEKQAE